MKVQSEKTELLGKRDFLSFVMAPVSKVLHLQRAMSGMGLPKAERKRGTNGFSNLAISAFLRPLRVQRNSPRMGLDVTKDRSNYNCGGINKNFPGYGGIK